MGLVAGKCPWCGREILNGNPAPSLWEEVQQFLSNPTSAIGPTRLDVLTSLAVFLGCSQGDIPFLIECLSDAEAGVRIEAARMLADIGKDGSSAIPALEELTQDNDPEVQAAARNAIERIRHR